MDSVNGRLYVGGISSDTSASTLTEHFSKYGEVHKASVIARLDTGNGKAFGFVNFKDPAMAHQALRNTHIILGREVEVKPAKRRIPRVEDQNQNNGCTSNNKKIFVGGLPSTLTEVEFKNYFEQYGAITDSVVMRDKEKNIPRGFGFVTFDSEDAVNDVLQESFHELKNKRVEVKRADPKYRIQQKKLHTSDCYNTGLGSGSSSGYNYGQSYTHPYYIVYYVPNTSAPPSPYGNYPGPYGYNNPA